MGKLYLVPTPIGNLKDITLRAIEVLQSVEVLASEDTRITLRLMNHLGIKKRLISYHKHNEQGQGEFIIDLLKDGIDVAIVTDAGTPGISDPGSIIVTKCIEEGIPFEVLPGATAITTAVVYSGLDTSGFVFKGFLPRENKPRREVLTKLKDIEETLIFYEAPHRLVNTLKAIQEVLGNRKISLCRELTKMHEEVLRFTLDEAISYYNEVEPRGEYVLVIQGKSLEEIKKEMEAKWNNITIKEHIVNYMKDGLSKKEAIKVVARDRGLPKNEIYKLSLDINNI
ncbi:16S rRNA (cytidine1402-2'-O)-methyltransferase [Hathewaya proteolytica DSM 3090]|uniref:Ribosomal RNA small subunit methyltransferase I n=1 Tax=Hathewaya proteolytica DSM 3090 TaxID=1121331 RepID=A0A1M6R399_9CLOT|nr:16S rRNA (cytidine(1402)-2'-O)-methyltransferase [Hathewaya proteolytica]SHK26949.1 16S rRNA (cytidine1402-2'-O)-methyltransferase [Hathewaya proteolytica DSM 3090]